LNTDDKVATVKYDDRTTTPDKIRKAISMAGYKADSLAADPKAYKMLPDHCKGMAVITAPVKKEDCATTCKDKSVEAKAACCPKGCATTPKTETTTATEAKSCCPSGTVKVDAKGCCPSGTAKMDANKTGEVKSCPTSSTVKIDGSAKLQSTCDPKGCKTACPSNKTTETAAPKVK
jgi:hypothetical protein